MATNPVIQRADEVEAIAIVLIAKYHPHLTDANILYLFTDKKRKKCDRVRIGSAAKMGALQRFLASNMLSVESGHDFLIMIDLNAWAFMDDADQRRLIDHELCHCGVFVKSGAGFVRLHPSQDKADFSEWTWGIIGHDIEEFAGILLRHGYPKADGPEQEFMEAVRQLPLPGLAVMAQSRN